jgi:secondary thiamine-phosphate synthase enzyme
VAFIQPSSLIQLNIRSSARSEMIDITRAVEEKLFRAGVKSALVFIFVPHTTAGVCLNEAADANVRADVMRKLDTMIPQQESYYTHQEGNSDAHVKTALTGNSITVLFEKNRLRLGQWQGVFLCEFDGPRERTVWIRALDYGQEALD